MRWCLWLSEFDYDVKYRKDRLNTHADALFRLHALDKATVPVDAAIL